MGQAVSIARTKNDFELVIRATKELEWILETQFGAPNGKTVGLHDKISAARIPGSEQPLPEAVTRKMRKLVTIRNSLVHDREVNSIADRSGFVKDWQEVDTTVETLWLAPAAPTAPEARPAARKCHPGPRREPSSLGPEEAAALRSLADASSSRVRVGLGLGLGLGLGFGFGLGLGLGLRVWLGSGLWARLRVMD